MGLFGNGSASTPKTVEPKGAEYDRRLREAGENAIRTMPGSVIADKAEAEWDVAKARAVYRGHGYVPMLPELLANEILRRLRGN